MAPLCTLPKENVLRPSLALGSKGETFTLSQKGIESNGDTAGT